MSLKGTAWAPIGPSPISQGASPVNGLVSAIAVNPANPNIIYIGTAGGGAWRSDDGGATWVPLFDRHLRCGRRAGRARDRSGQHRRRLSRHRAAAFSARDQPQAGLFKSTDGGASWIRLGSGYPAGNTGNAILFVNQSINVILVDPANSNILYLASTSGCFRSTDGGLNWTAGSTPSATRARWSSTPPRPPPHASCTPASAGAAWSSRPTAARTGRTILNAPTPAVAAALAGGGFSRLQQGHRRAGAADVAARRRRHAGAVRHAATAPAASGAGSGRRVPEHGSGRHLDDSSTAAGMATSARRAATASTWPSIPRSPGDGANDIIYFGTLGQARSTTPARLHGA